MSSTTQQQLGTADTESFSSVEIVSIPPDGVDVVWDMVMPHLRRATDRLRRFDVDDYRVMCGDGDAFLWVVWGLGAREIVAVLVTDLVGYPSGWKAARIIACGGNDLYAWRDETLRRIEEWARGEGCDSVEIVGRKGWGRVCPEYEHIESVFSKEL